MFFHADWKKLGKEYDWVTNPDSGFRYDVRKHWTEVEDFTREAGDIKYVWEKSNIVATMNAGYIPKDVWVQDMEVGGGRVIGEACHFIDLCSFLADSKVKAVCMNALGENPQENADNVSILLKYENGSNAVINFLPMVRSLMQRNGWKFSRKKRCWCWIIGGN